MKTAQERQRIYVFETGQKSQIGALVASYRPSLANWSQSDLANSNQKRRVKQVTNEDRLRLHGNLVNCRRALVEQNLLKRPSDGALTSEFGGNFLKNTLRRLSHKKMEKLRAASSEDEVAYKGFNHAFWAFTKSDMMQTLSLMTEQDESNALEVFHLILTYAGK